MQTVISLGLYTEPINCRVSNLPLGRDSEHGPSRVLQTDGRPVELNAHAPLREPMEQDKFLGAMKIIGYVTILKVQRFIVTTFA